MALIVVGIVGLVAAMRRGEAENAESWTPVQPS